MHLPLLILLAAPSVAAPPSALDGFAEKDFKGKMETLDAMARAKKPLTKAEVAMVVDILREDTTVFVRMKAAEALVVAQADLKLALAALVEALDDANEDLPVRQGAVKTLGELGKGSKRVEAALMRAGEQTSLKAPVANALTKIGAVESARKFQGSTEGEIIRPKTPSVPATPAFEEKGDAFVAALSSMDPDRRRAAIGSVAKRGYDRKKWSDAEVEAIRKTASDPDLDVRCMALSALGHLNETSKMVPMLMEALKSPENRLTDAAAFALSNAGALPVEHLGPILDVLESSKALNTRISLMHTLPHFGKAAKPAVPVLCKLLKDPFAQIRLVSAMVLQNIGRLDPETVVKAMKDLPPEQDKNIEPRIKQLRDTFIK